MADDDVPLLIIDPNVASTTAMEAFIRDVGLVSHQIDNYEEFVHVKLKRILKEVEIVVSLRESTVSRDPAYAEAAELRIKLKTPGSRKHPFNDADERFILPKDVRGVDEATYEVPVFVTLDCRVMNDYGEVMETRKIENHRILNLPVMVRSSLCTLSGDVSYSAADADECEFDKGGYFIVKGREVVLIPQERLATNRIMRHFDKKTAEWSVECSCRSEKSALIAVPFGVTITMRNKNDVVYWVSDDMTERVPVTFLIVALYEASADRLDIVNEPPAKRARRRVALASDESSGEEEDDSDSDGSDADDAPIDWKREFDAETLEWLRPTFQMYPLEKHAPNRREALDWLAKHSNKVHTDGVPKARRIELMRNRLNNTFIVHSSDKYAMLKYMVTELVRCVAGKARADDRDHMMNKFFATCSTLLNELVSGLVSKWVTKAAFRLRRLALKADSNMNTVFEDVPLAASHRSISTGITYSLGTGNWGARTGAVDNTLGVAQTLQRFTMLSYYAHLRKLTSSANANSKITELRSIHGSHYGTICPAETPEGADSAGIIKNLALHAVFSRNCYGDAEIDKYVRLTSETGPVAGLTQAGAPPQAVAQALLFVNGDMRGRVNSRITVEIFRQGFLNRRRRGVFPRDASVWVSKDETKVEIRLGEGRLMRPVFIVREGKITRFARETSFHELVRAGIVEYLDAAETENCLIAMDPSTLAMCPELKWTHCEIHPSAMLGIPASTIPFPENNQSPRNTYYSGMAKQTVSVPCTNYRQRFDGAIHVLQYGQRPIASTRTARMIGLDEMPAGQNLIAAICIYTGYNQEDSLIASRSLIDRGGLRSESYHVFETTYDEGETTLDLRDPVVFAKIRNGRTVNYEKLTEFDAPLPEDLLVLKGADPNHPSVYDLKRKNCDSVPIGARVKAGDVVIQKFIKNDDGTYRDVSVKLAPSDLPGRVCDVRYVTTPDGRRQIQVKVLTIHVPEVGDKFSSRHAQKGILSAILPDEDMPYSLQTGIRPDIIINCHAFPSRMTGGHLREMLEAKLACLQVRDGGTYARRAGYVDATPFDSDRTDNAPEEVARAIFEEYGMLGCGSERMVHGMKGFIIDAVVNMAPVLIHCLKHQVRSKYHARSTGPVSQVSRQPTRGRKNVGGIRFGEMERDCLISHGAAALQQERTLISSDHFVVWVCKSCGRCTTATLRDGFIENQCVCAGGGAVVDAKEMHVRYAFKLLLHELKAYCMDVRLFAE